MTYGLTWLTIGGINHFAKVHIGRQLAEEVLWRKVSVKKTGTDASVPATNDLVKKKTTELDKAKIGCKPDESLPLPLQGQWQHNEDDKQLSAELTEKILGHYFEDPFDHFYAAWLFIPLQPIEREQTLRNEYGYTDLMAEVSDDQREEMLRHFGNVYGEFMKLFPFRMIRWVNGWVQVTAIAVFWLSFLLVIQMYYSRVLWERRQADLFFPFRSLWVESGVINWSDPPWGDKVLTEEQVRAQLAQLYRLEPGEEPGTAVLMLREVYEGYLRGEITAAKASEREGAILALDQATERRLKKIDSDMAALVYLGWSLPSLGFVGTVLGLGMALLTAGDMVTPNSELQKDAMQTVSFYLGRAFDKTFVALLLSLVQMAFIYALRQKQEAVVLGFQDRITRGVVQRLG
jgi:hypothetical protein